MEEKKLGNLLPTPKYSRRIMFSSQSQRLIVRDDSAENPAESPKLNKKHQKSHSIGKQPKADDIWSAGIELPKLKKHLVKISKKQNKKKLSVSTQALNTDELCLKLNMQCDPMIKGVYSSSLFAVSSPHQIPTIEELRYRQEAINNKNNLVQT